MSNCNWLYFIADFQNRVDSLYGIDVLPLAHLPPPSHRPLLLPSTAPNTHGLVLRLKGGSGTPFRPTARPDAAAARPTTPRSYRPPPPNESSAARIARLFDVPDRSAEVEEAAIEAERLRCRRRSTPALPYNSDPPSPLMCSLQGTQHLLSALSRPRPFVLRINRRHPPLLRLCRHLQRPFWACSAPPAPSPAQPSLGDSGNDYHLRAYCSGL